MKNLVLVLTLALAACGGGTSTKYFIPGSTPPGASPAVTPVTLNASLTPSGNDFPGTMQVTARTRAYIPDPVSIAVIQNASETWHVSLSIGTVTCDYIHDPNPSRFRWGAGCSTLNTYVDLNQGESVTARVSGSPSQTTSIQVTIGVEN